MTRLLCLRSRRVRPCLEVLEDRIVPAVFNVAAGDVATLIADINIANGNGQSNTINLTASIYHLTQINNYWYGPNGLPAIAGDLTIHGNGAVITRDNFAPDFRLFYVSGGLELAPGRLTMDNVALEGGIAKGGDSDVGGGGLGAGGAIFNQGTLNLTAVTLTNNEALGGSSGIDPLGSGGGGMGGDAPSTDDGGGFGGSLGGTFGGVGGGAFASGGGGGGGFLTGANGLPSTGSAGGNGGGLGEFGSPGDGGMGGGGSGSGSGNGGGGGDFGNGGRVGRTNGGGGGGVGGGGGAGFGGGNGGFGGGGGLGAGILSQGGQGGFGGGGGGSNGGNRGLGGVGGGTGGDAITGGLGGGGGAGMGGALFNMGADSAHSGSGQAILVNCTLTNNTAQGGHGGSGGNGGSGFGGALFNLDGQVKLTNDTLDGNITTGGAGGSDGDGIGGAVFSLAFGNDIDTSRPVAATLLLNNSILADSISSNDLNFGASNGLGVNTAMVSGSHNLVMSNNGSTAAGVIISRADPHLGPLQNNGGLTPTMLPSPGSPVLGTGDPSLAPGTDQRGASRPPNGPTDLGAVQVSAGRAPGGGGTPASAGPIGLAIEEFELTVDRVLVMIEGAFHLPHASLDTTIAQLQNAIDNDPLTPTSEGQLAVLLGEVAALNAFGSS